LEIVRSDQFKFTSSGLAIPGATENNLCIKAYELLKADFDISPVHIHLHKVIPMGAGLGGGSSDGAFTLKMVNKEFELGLDVNQLQAYARTLGADCPFFIENEPKLVSGIGEVFDDVTLDLSDYKMAIVNLGIHIPTKIAFSQVTPVQPQVFVKEILQEDISKWKGWLKNDFEQSVFAVHPEILEIKEKLYEVGAVYASMTGSGASVYGLFENSTLPIEIEKCFPNYEVWF